MKKVYKFIKMLPLFILISILIVSLTILTDSYLHPDEVPSFLGWKPLIVFSDSMEPEMGSGDVAIVEEVDVTKLKANDIVAIKDKDLVITQRILSVTGNNENIKFKVKSDNSKTDDSQYVSADKIEGKYHFNIILLGSIAMFIQSPIGALISLSVPVVMLLAIQSFELSDNRTKKIKAKKRKQTIKVKPKIIEEIEILDDFEECLEVI